MNVVAQEKFFQKINSMGDNQKEQIIETCLSSASVIEASVTELFELQDWFDVYVCSDEFNSLPVNTKKKVVKNFRDLYVFLDVLNEQMQ